MEVFNINNIKILKHWKNKEYTIKNFEKVKPIHGTQKVRNLVKFFKVGHLSLPRMFVDKMNDTIVQELKEKTIHNWTTLDNNFLF